MSEDECVSVTRHVNRSAHKLVIDRAGSSAVTSRILGLTGGFGLASLKRLFYSEHVKN